MAHTKDEEAKILARIKILEEGEMKPNLLELFLQTTKEKQGISSSKSVSSKPLFVNASF